MRKLDALLHVLRLVTYGDISDRTLERSRSNVRKLDALLHVLVLVTYEVIISERIRRERSPLNEGVGCTYASSRAGDLNRHIKRKHGGTNDVEEEKELINCMDLKCDYTCFYEMNDLLNHQQAEHWD